MRAIPDNQGQNRPAALSTINWSNQDLFLRKSGFHIVEVINSAAQKTKAWPYR